MTLLSSNHTWRWDNVNKKCDFGWKCNNCNHEEIVSNARLSPSTVSFHLKKLGEGNIIEFVKKGRRSYYNLLSDKNEIMNLLITYKESFFDGIVDNIVDMWETR